jgi:2-dehydropantoate 2-reductase
MDVCVFGAGAVGGYLAARLAGCGRHRISVVARGLQFDALRTGGLQLSDPQGDLDVSFAAVVEVAADLPPQDIVFVTLKAPSLPAVADDLRGLLRPHGFAVFVSNGIPWWWNHGLDPPTCQVMRVDPEGRLRDRLGADRALGCVVYSANQVVAPGKVVHQANNRWVLGEPDDTLTPRLTTAVELLQTAGLGAEISTDLRREIGIKLLRNAAFNPLCALTRLNAGDLAAAPDLAALAQNLSDEVTAVMGAIGWPLPPFRIADVLGSDGGPGARSTVKPSMLQDAEAGRPMEVEALVGQLQQFARERDLRIPTIDAVYALIAGLDAAVRRQGSIF